MLNSIPYRISRQTRLSSLITVHLLYIHFWIYSVPATLSRIISHADCSDTYIDKTTPTATFREQLLRYSIHPRLFHKLTVILCCFVLFRWFKVNFKLQLLDLRSGRGANNCCLTMVAMAESTHDERIKYSL